MIDGMLIGLDPGRATGFTCFLKENSNLILLRYGELVGYQDIYNILIDQRYKKAQFIVEDYRANVSTKPQLEAAYKVGFIQGVLNVNGIASEFQMPSVRKGYLELSKKVLIYNGSYSKHCIDSAAHVLRYIDKIEGLKDIKHTFIKPLRR